ncbi:MAG: methyltransferase domain-containing protein [Bryobacterales bacterium]|nr:methyltransferase domain-containing protein [Bryobacterales bacterium]
MLTSPLADLPKAVVERLGLQPGMRVLDIGCGPGSLAREILSVQPEARPLGLDPDRGMLRFAQTRAGERACWTLGLGQALPFADETADCVAMTLLLHHLTRPQKERALAEAMRVLRPGGRLLITDWTAPKGVARLGFLLIRVLDGFEQTADHAHGRVAPLIQAAGVQDLRALQQRHIPFGTVTLFLGTKPDRSQPVASQTAKSKNGAAPV